MTAEHVQLVLEIVAELRVLYVEQVAGVGVLDPRGRGG
jgi:hypothetical protein